MKTLTLEQCKSLLSVLAERGTEVDHALVVCLLMIGADARTWTWQNALENPIFQPFAVYQSIKSVVISKNLSVFPFSHASFRQAHWLNTTVRLQQAVFCGTSRNKALTTQEVTRRLKRYGKMAGIPVDLMSLRTINNTHQMFLDIFKDADVFAEALDLLRAGNEGGRSPFFKKAQPKKEPRLHGLGRRHAYKIAG